MQSPAEQSVTVTPTVGINTPERRCTRVDSGSDLCQACTVLDNLAMLCKQVFDWGSPPGLLLTVADRHAGVRAEAAAFRRWIAPERKPSVADVRH